MPLNVFGGIGLSLDKPWLWAFGVLVPYVIIYLTKPRPHKKTVPSLMFMMTVQGRMKKNAFFNKLLRNFIFFIQLFIFSVLAFALTHPLLGLDANLKSNNVVLIIDASASMQVKDGSLTRFEKAIEQAKEYNAKRTSIVLAENMPLVLLKSDDSKKASPILSKLKPKATSTNIGDAMMQADELLGGKKGRVILFSDFTSNQGSDALVAKRKLLAQETDVELINFGKPVANIGIVEIKFEKDVVIIYVKNYFKEEKEISLIITNNGNELNKTKLKIEPGAIESSRFKVIEGINRIEIPEKDLMMVDNIAYVSMPESQKIKALVFSNKKNIYLISALNSIDDIELTVSEPPTLPEIKNYDLIIIANIDKSLVLPGTFSDIKSVVNKGGSLVIMAQDDLATIDTKGLLSFMPSQVSGYTSINKKIDNEFTKDIDFGTQSKHLSGTSEEGSIVLAESDSNEPLLIFTDNKKGKVIYYGIYDEQSDFKDSIDYPLFWYDLTGYLFGRKQLKNYNFKTGTVLTMDKQNVKTPAGEIKTSRLFLDEQGVYEYDNIKIAANLLDVKESDLEKIDKNIFETEKSALGEYYEKKKADFELIIPLIIIAIIAFLAELAYLKRRGDI